MWDGIEVAAKSASTTSVNATVQPPMHFPHSVAARCARPGKRIVPACRSASKIGSKTSTAAI